MSFDFTGLTRQQRRLLSFQGWSVAASAVVPRPTKNTLRVLLERGLLIEHKRIQKFRDGMNFEWSEYSVPLDVHAAWCAECSKRQGGRAS